MKLIGHIIFSFVSNVVALLAAAYFIAGFTLELTFMSVLKVALLLTAVNIFLKPIIKFLLSPIIVLTFGLFTLIINAAILYGIDSYSQQLTISSLGSLIYATILIGAINMVLNFAARSKNARS